MNKVTWIKAEDYRGMKTYSANGYTIKKGDRGFNLYQRGICLGVFPTLADAKQWVESK